MILRALRLVLRLLSSSRLALVLVFLLILFSVAGAMLPQEGLMGRADIQKWQQAHPLVTQVFKPLGFFRVFYSIPFLVLIALLALNTLTCTLLYFFREGGFAVFKGPRAARCTGFFLIHLSLIVIFIGGFWSAAGRMDGYMVLIEGQGFQEEHKSYVRLAEGPLYRENHKGFLFRLTDVKTSYQKGHYLVGVTAKAEIFEQNRLIETAVIEINRPYIYRDIHFTLDETGFAPRLEIRNKKKDAVMVDSFVALQSFKRGIDRVYSDFLPLPIVKGRVIVTLYPAFTRGADGKAVKSGEEPQSPLLIVETEDEAGKLITRQELTMGDNANLGDYSLNFKGLRRWASFKVADDPGYPLVWFALWAMVVGFLSRYLPDLRSWFEPQREDRQ